jgi:CheY-like chemotaxis protein
VGEKSVLVIEDNDLNMQLVVALLEMENFRVLRASDAEAGIQLAREYRPDLIIMDIQLPGMDGLTATMELKADKVMREIPIVALTAYAMKGDKEKILDSGCDGYISKPIDSRHFLETVSHYIKQVKDLQDLKSMPSHDRNF